MEATSNVRIQLPDDGSLIKKFRCAVCDDCGVLNGEDQFILHEIGRNHVDRLKKMQAGLVCTDCKRQDCKEALGGSCRLDTEDPRKTPFICTLCRKGNKKYVIMKSQIAYHQHLSGKKHKERVRKQIEFDRMHKTNGEEFQHREYFSLQSTKLPQQLGVMTVSNNHREKKVVTLKCRIPYEDLSYWLLNTSVSEVKIEHIDCKEENTKELESLNLLFPSVNQNYNKNQKKKQNSGYIRLRSNQCCESKGSFTNRVSPRKKAFNAINNPSEHSRPFLVNPSPSTTSMKSRRPWAPNVHAKVFASDSNVIHPSALSKHISPLRNTNEDKDQLSAMDLDYWLKRYIMTMNAQVTQQTGTNSLGDLRNKEIPIRANPAMVEHKFVQEDAVTKLAIDTKKISKKSDNDYTQDDVPNMDNKIQLVRQRNMIILLQYV